MIEKSYISNYKDEAILFDVYFQYEEKTKRQSLYINKKLWLNPRSCDREIVTTQEVFQHFKKNMEELVVLLYHQILKVLHK